MVIDQQNANILHCSSLPGAEALEAIQGSLDNERRIRDVVLPYLQAGLVVTDSPYSPFARVADGLGYTGDPPLDPSPFFTTMHGYATQFAQESSTEKEEQR